MGKYAHGFNKNDSTKLDNMLGSGNNFYETYVYIYNRENLISKKSFEKILKEQHVAQIKTIKSLNCTWSGSSFTQDIKYFKISKQMPGELYVLCEKPFEISELSQTPEELWSKNNESPESPFENFLDVFLKFKKSFDEIKEIWGEVNANQDMVNSYIEKTDNPKETPQERSKRISESTAYGVFASSVNELKEKRAECETLQNQVDHEIIYTKPSDNPDDKIVKNALEDYNEIITDWDGNGSDYSQYVGNLAKKKIEEFELTIEKIENGDKPAQSESQVSDDVKNGLRKKFEDFEEAFNEIKEIWGEVNEKQDMVNSYIEKTNDLKETPQERSKRISESTAYGVFASSVNELKEKRAECESLKKEIDRKIDHTKPFDHYDDGRISEIIGYDLTKYRNIMYYEYRTYVGELAEKNIDKIEYFIEEIESNGEPTRQETPPAYSAYKPKPITSFGRPYGTDPGQHSSFGTGGAPTKAGSGHSANPPAQPHKTQGAPASRKRASSVSSARKYDATPQNKSGTTHTTPQKHRARSYTTGSIFKRGKKAETRKRRNTVASQTPSTSEMKNLPSRIKAWFKKIFPEHEASQNNSKITFYYRIQNKGNNATFEKPRNEHPILENVNMVTFHTYNDFFGTFKKLNLSYKEISRYQCKKSYVDSNGQTILVPTNESYKLIIFLNPFDPKSVVICCNVAPTLDGPISDKYERLIADAIKKLQRSYHIKSALGQLFKK